MKKWFPIVMLCMLCLTGCFRRSNALLYPVQFFYLEQEIEYGEKGSILSAELHESAGHEGDLNEMLYLYFIGPVEENLVNPFPEGTEFLNCQLEGTELTVNLSDKAASMSDPQFSLASTCLSMTCMNIVPVDTVTVNAASHSVTTARDRILIQDEFMPQIKTRRK